MKGRRQFIKILFGFFITLLSLKYYKVVNAMNVLPYHHLSDGTFRNLPGSPKRGNYKNRGNFFKFLYKGLVQRKMFALVMSSFLNN